MDKRDTMSVEHQPSLASILTSWCIEACVTKLIKLRSAKYVGWLGTQYRYPSEVVKRGREVWKCSTRKKGSQADSSSAGGSARFNFKLNLNLKPVTRVAVTCTLYRTTSSFPSNIKLQYLWLTLLLANRHWAASLCPFDSHRKNKYDFLCTPVKWLQWLICPDCDSRRLPVSDRRLWILAIEGAQSLWYLQSFLLAGLAISTN